MKAELIQIGNSKGIRIPKAVIEQCAFGNEVELSVKDKHLIISSHKQARQGWRQCFQKMAENGDDNLIIPDTELSDWDKNEWKW